MKIYYKNGGFYLEPQESAVEISEELHRTLIEGQSQGKQIVTGLDGVPMLAEPQPSQYHHWDGTAWKISPGNKPHCLPSNGKKCGQKSTHCETQNLQVVYMLSN